MNKSKWWQDKVQSSA